MDNKAGGLVSGLGGAALLAMFFAPAGTPSPKPLADPSAKHDTPSSGVESKTAVASHSDEGPWTAVCDEYETKFESGPRHVEGSKGAWDHALPQDAQSDAIEYTKTIKDIRSGNSIEQKFEVKSHPVGNPSACVPYSYADPELLIATIPDPLSSHFSLYFDRDIDALEAAAAVAMPGQPGYSISHYWLPWDQTSNPSTAAADAPRRAEWKLRNEEPGILVFRRPDGGRLFVFLVGETPTSGIAKVQFGHALCYVDELLNRHASLPVNAKNGAGNSLCAISASPTQQTERAIDIVGPHFSGSLQGMAEVLSESKFIAPFTPIHVLSPNARANSLIDSFCEGPRFGYSHAPDDWSFSAPCAKSQVSQKSHKLTNPSLPDRARSGNAVVFSGASSQAASSPTAKPSGSRPSWFASLELNFNSGRSAAIKYLNELGYKDHIAFLHEDESPLSASQDLDIKKGEDLLVLHFPRDLSSLRNKTDALATSDTEINGVKLSLWSVPVTLGEKVHVLQDGPPSLDSDHEAARIDHALQAVVVSLRKHKTRALIVDASNSLDTLFLLEYFRRELPNMRFAALDADEFEVGRPQNVELTGTISITGLPLLRDGVLDATGAEPNHVAFGSADTEGTYLAAALLIHNAYRGDEDWTEPCATVSVVGRSGFVLTAVKNATMPVFPCLSTAGKTPLPLHLSSGVDPSSDQTVGQESPEVPRSWNILLVFAFVATLLHLISLWRSGVLWRSNSTSPKRPLGFAYPAECGNHEAKRIAVLVGLNNQYLLLEFALCTTNAILWRFFANDRAFFSSDAPVLSSDWLIVGFFVAHALAFLCCAASTAVMMCRGEDKRSVRGYIVPMFLSSTYLIVTSVVWLKVLLGAPMFTRPGLIFNTLRIVMIPEGLSPFAPFLAITIAYIVYCRVELNGIDWASRRRVPLELSPGAHELLRSGYSKLVKRLPPFSLPTPGMLCLAISAPLLFFSALNILNSLAGLEGVSFQWWIIVLGFGPLLFGITLMISRAWSIWESLQDMLHWLHQDTGMEPAFKKIHEEDLPKMRVWDLGKRDQDLTIQAKTVESLQPLVLDQEVKQARLALDVIRLAEINGRQHTSSDADTLSIRLNTAMQKALPYLEPMVAQRIQAPQFQHYLALRFVSVIRYTLLQIRNLYTFAVYGFALLAVCVVTYPFEGRSNLTALLSLLFIFLLSSAGLLLAQVQRNAVLSMIEGTGAGQVSYIELFKHLVSIGGVPALLVVATQFPALAQVVLSWAKPGLDLLK